jgi:hypothetical protein
MANSLLRVEAREQQVGKIDAGDQQDHADGAPEDNEGPLQLSADVLLEGNGDDSVLISTESVRTLCVLIKLRGKHSCFGAGLLHADSGFQPTQKSDNVAPVARFVKIQWGKHVDFCAGRKNRAKVECRR